MYGYSVPTTCYLFCKTDPYLCLSSDPAIEHRDFYEVCFGSLWSLHQSICTTGTYHVGNFDSSHPRTEGCYCRQTSAKACAGFPTDHDGDGDGGDGAVTGLGASLFTPPPTFHAFSIPQSSLSTQVSFVAARITGAQRCQEPT